jgi:hypothetical protein
MAQAGSGWDMPSPSGSSMAMTLIGLIAITALILGGLAYADRYTDQATGPTDAASMQNHFVSYSAAGQLAASGATVVPAGTKKPLIARGKGKTGATQVADTYLVTYHHNGSISADLDTGNISVSESGWYAVDMTLVFGYTSGTSGTNVIELQLLNATDDISLHTIAYNYSDNSGIATLPMHDRVYLIAGKTYRPLVNFVEEFTNLSHYNFSMRMARVTVPDNATDKTSVVVSASIPT